MLLKFVLKFAIEDWRTNCRLPNADYGRVLAQSNDGLEIILKFAIENWRTNYRLKNADYGRVLAQSNDGMGVTFDVKWDQCRHNIREVGRTRVSTGPILE